MPEAAELAEPAAVPEAEPPDSAEAPEPVAEPPEPAMRQRCARMMEAVARPAAARITISAIRVAVFIRWDVSDNQAGYHVSNPRA